MKMPAALKLALVPLFAVPLLVGCSNMGDQEQQGPTPVLDEANLTVEEVTARFGEAITRPGFVYHMQIKLEQDGAPWAMEGIQEVWVDAAGDRARDESDLLLHFDEDTRYQAESVLTDGGRYSRNISPDTSEPVSRIRAERCDAGNAAICLAVGYLIAGADLGGDFTIEVRRGSYAKRPAIIVVGVGRQSREIGTSTTSARLYMDGETYLPVAHEGEGDFDYGRQGQGNWRYTYENEFVPTGSLPEDFFQPASIGYVEPDPEAPLVDADLGMTVYWLGTSSEGDDDLPPLALDGARVADPERGPGYSLTLDYRLGEDEFGPAVVTLEEWHLSEWNASHTGVMQVDPSGPPVKVGNWWERPCWENKNVELPAGRAVIVLGFENDTMDKQPTTAAGDRVCPSSPHDRFWALVYLGSTVIKVDAPATTGYQGEYSESPYDSLEGMEAIARALQPRR
jgi:hypothetical protein